MKRAEEMAERDTKRLNKEKDFLKKLTSCPAGENA